jgi:hypothetical protein
MAPFLISPLVKAALGIVAGGAAVVWAVREYRRLNNEIARAKTVKITEPIRRDQLQTLRRDPRTGDYRPM